MPTYVLEGGSSVTLPAKPLTLRVQGHRQADIRLEAWRDGAADPSAISPMPGMLVLPRVTASTEVRVVPAGTRTFGSGTVVALSAAIELHADADPERAVLHGVDLSGLAERELLRVDPAGAEIRLTALGVVADTPLPPLAARARDLARELLGVERLPAAEATDLHISVDASASMRALVVDGSVAAAADVVIGVSRVTSTDRQVSAAVGSERSWIVESESVAGLPRAVHDALAQAPLLTGFRCRGGWFPSADATRTTLCVVSDGVPANLPQSTAAAGVALVAIAPPSSRDVLTARAPATTAWVPVAEWGARSAYDLLTGDESALRDTVTGLLRALVPEASPLHTRLPRSEASGAYAERTVLREPPR